MHVDDFLNNEVSRRRFLEQSAAGVVAGVAAPVTGHALAISSAAAPIRLGIIGVRRRGLELAKSLQSIPGTLVRTVCDLDPKVRRTAVQTLAQHQPQAPVPLSDYRRLLDDPAIDAVVIATPDHWHVPMAVDALAAEKDLYIEAPVTHELEETGLLLTAARHSKQIIQCGLQQRSSTHFRSAIDQIRGGTIGRVVLARAWAVHRRSIGQARDDDLRPPRWDYQQWLGSAAQTPFDPLRFHYNWRWFWDFGSGELGDWGVHLLDIARWGLDVGLPRRVSASGLQKDPSVPVQTPDTLLAQFEYDHASIIWEHRLWTDQGMEGRTAGVAFYGDRGTLIVDRSGWKIYGSTKGPSAPASELLKPHLENFLVSIRTRSQPSAPLEIGCLSSAMCHLANAAYRAGRDLAGQECLITPCG